MKRSGTMVAGASVAVLALSAAFFLWQMTRPGWGFDFRLRYNELTCLRAGVDPFLVWSGQSGVSGLEPYTEHSAETLANAGAHPFVHAYTPWTYTLLFPFSLLDYPASLACWRAVLTFCFALLLAFAFRTARTVCGNVRAGLLALAATAVFVALNVENGLTLNFGLLLALSVCVMGRLLDRGRDFSAGVCLALLMMKPQIGTLFILPLLFHRRFKTLAVGAAICLAGTVPPALLCHRSPADLILQVPRAGAYIQRTAFFPKCIYTLIAHRFGDAVPLVASALLGLSLCVCLVWFLRKERDWLVQLTAPAITCVAWTYSMAHDRLVLALPVVLLVCALCRARETKTRVVLSALLLFLPLDAAYQYCCRIIPGVPPAVIRATFLWRSAHNLLALFLLAGFCLWYSFRREAEE